MFDIITIGSSTRDVFIKSDKFKIIEDNSFDTNKGLCLSLGSKFEIDEMVIATGGGGTNVAVTFVRQGLETACIGVVGEDNNGTEILDDLKKEGINIEYFQKHNDDKTAYSVILVHSNGSRTILSYKGEGQHFDINKIPLDKLQTKWLFLSSLGGHYDFLEKIMNWAEENGVTVASNPGGKELAHGLDKIGSFLKNMDVVIMNREEASKLVGVDFENKDEVFKKLSEVTGKITVMTMGPEGVWVSDKENIYEAGIPDSPVIERTGAGDAWSSGFVAEYINSENIEKAIQLATANASSVVSKFGSKEGILKKGETGGWPLVEIIKK